MDPQTIKTLYDIGFSAVILVMLYKVWDRLNVITDRILTYLEEARTDRALMMTQLTALDARIKDCEDELDDTAA